MGYLVFFEVLLVSMTLTENLLQSSVFAVLKGNESIMREFAVLKDVI